MVAPYQHCGHAELAAENAISSYHAVCLITAWNAKESAQADTKW